MTDTVAADELRLYIEALENLVEQKKGIQDDIKDRFSLAKSDGFDTKALRTVLARRALERAAREGAYSLVKLYEDALEG